jgi:hypothetical protein
MEMCFTFSYSILHPAPKMSLIPYESKSRKNKLIFISGINRVIITMFPIGVNIQPILQQILFFCPGHHTLFVPMFYAINDYNLSV